MSVRAFWSKLHPTICWCIDCDLKELLLRLSNTHHVNHLKIPSALKLYFFPKVILYTFFSFYSFMVVWGFAVGVLRWVLEFGIFSWWGLGPLVWGLLGFWGRGSLYKHKRETLGKNKPALKYFHKVFNIAYFLTSELMPLDGTLSTKSYGIQALNMWGQRQNITKDYTKQIQK